jgi:hypothetical protein
VYESSFKEPEGKANPTIGFIKSLTNAVINFDEAAPITNAIAKPIMPKVLRNCMNCSIIDCDFGGGAVSAILEKKFP